MRASCRSTCAAGWASPRARSSSRWSTRTAARSTAVSSPGPTAAPGTGPRPGSGERCACRAAGLAVWSASLDVLEGPAPARDVTWTLARAREQTLRLELPPRVSATPLRFVLRIGAREDPPSELVDGAELVLDEHGLGRIVL